MSLLNLLIVSVCVVIAGLVVALGWRWASRQWVLPCPSWLSKSVDGSIGEAILRTHETLDRMAPQPGQRVLEIGPGPGRLLIPIANRVLPGGSVVGIELQERMIAKLKARAEAAGVRNLTCVNADICQAAIPENSFDLVYLVTVLGEIPDRETALQRAFAALRPGGRLSITEIVLDPHYQRLQVVNRLAREAGFIQDEVLGSWWHYTANFRKPAAESTL